MMSVTKTRPKTILVPTGKWCGTRKCTVKQTRKQKYTIVTNQLMCCKGYVYTSGTDSCAPVCSTGCANGTCVDPDVCQCAALRYLDPNTRNKCLLPTCDHISSAVGFDGPLYLNNTFYLECDTETSCFDESKAISRETYYLECEEVEIISRGIINPKEHNESTTESYLLINKTTTESDDESTAAYGNLTEVYIFTNETTTDLEGLSNNGLVNSTEADVFISESSTAVESISKNDISISSEANGITTVSTTSRYGIFINDDANSTETNVITPEASTEVNGILNHDVANSSEVHVVTTKTTTDLYYEFKDNHNSTKADIFDNETTTEHHDVLKDINATSTKIDELSNKTDVHSLKAAKENSSDSSNVLAILGYSLAGVGATLALAFGAYRLKNAVQSGSYFIPETPRPPGFIELA
ncbi:uncharacterized protein LOC134792282 [Cydia splendana]|uniref:uncharacterized protein LOC134792282 n=1 Tax=Cydia splendana TaxID=1100963 RepID=UPI00300C53B6